MKGLLKFITCGSVDDGKSTLIGHILYDAKLLYADQEKALELDSKVGSREGAIDYSLLLDGLMAEREQGITIDVAYRYFTTDNRSFIVADTPGHEEYTRNMAVGASFADLSVILIDAKQGVLSQTRRHARICSLMGIKHFVFAINKMDLVQYSEDVFNNIKGQIIELAKEVLIESTGEVSEETSLKDIFANISIIPVSATEGDNVTKKSDNLPWYQGESLLSYLEEVDIDDTKEQGFYLPVQRVCRPNHEFRGFQGQIESGSVTVRDEIITLPSKEKAIVKSIHIGDKEVSQASKGQPVTIQLNKEVDVSRGCVIMKEADIITENRFLATLLWMDDTSLTEGKEYLVKIGTKLISGVISKIEYMIDVNTGVHTQALQFSKNEIGLCEVLLAEKIPLDEFHRHKTLGELILIDRVTNMTSACGVVEKRSDGIERLREHALFQKDQLVGRGELFDEFYYNLDSQTIFKHSKDLPVYHEGDLISIQGESYNYPEYFDILFLKDNVAIQIRNRKVTQILDIKDYEYSGYPVIDGRGFKIQVSSQEETIKFLNELCRNEVEDAKVLNHWLIFDTYRNVIFHSNYWVI